MEVEITTTEPSEVDPEEVAQALIDAGYYVHRVAVLDRANLAHTHWHDTGCDCPSE